MSVKELIKQRRSIYQFTEQRIDEQKIKSFLETAIWAPNHKLTEPWCFWVIGPQSQNKLAEIYADNRAQKHCEKGSEGYLKAFEKATAKFTAIPQVILVGQVIDSDQQIYKEDYAACSCAIQNLQLAAWEEGIGVQWSTGPIIKDERTYKILSISSNQIELIGALYMGYPKTMTQSNRKSIDKVSYWLD